jgi:exodeoxyribonuclease VII small subunit
LSDQKDADPSRELDFERAVERVEEIIEKIESGQIGLEQSIAEYERGVALIRRCRQALERAEQRVEELTAQMEAQAKGGGAGPAAPPRRTPTPEAPADGGAPF